MKETGKFPEALQIFQSPADFFHQRMVAAEMIHEFCTALTH